MNAYKAVMFDLDGTLCEYNVEPFSAFCEAFERAQATELLRAHPDVFNLKNYGVQLKALWAEGRRRFAQGERNAFPYGVSVENVTRLLRQAGVTKADLVERLRQGYLAAMLKHLGLREGAHRALERLRGRYRLGLITNGPSALQWNKVNRLQLHPRFDDVVVSDDVGVRKPDPAIFAGPLRRFNVAPHEALYVGDRLEYDVQGAHNAGIASVWLNARGESFDGRYPRPELEIAHLDQLLAWLKGPE